MIHLNVDVNSDSILKIINQHKNFLPIISNGHTFERDGNVIILTASNFDNAISYYKNLIIVFCK